MRPNLRFVVLALCFALSAGLALAQAPAAGSGSAAAAGSEAAPMVNAAPGVNADEMAKKLDATVEKLIAAYNAGDAKAFNAEFATSMAAIATPEVFKTLYVDNYMANLGKVTKRIMANTKCSFNEDAPLVVYDAEFEKGKGSISVNFIKEEAGLKVMQVQFAKGE